LNEAAGGLARFGGYGDCSGSLRAIIWLRGRSGEVKRERGPLLAAGSASRLMATIDLNSRMSAVWRRGGADLRSPAMIGATGMQRLASFAGSAMAGLMMCHTRTMKSGVEFDRMRAVRVR